MGGMSEQVDAACAALGGGQRLLGGGAFLPVHWGTFNLGLHDWNEPAETLLTLAAASRQRIVTPRLGQVFEPELVEGATPWWRLEAAT